MLAKIQTFTLLGIEAMPVEVEVDVSHDGDQKITLVGLPDAVVRESCYRVARAIVNSGFEMPEHEVVVNLAPADLRKQAASFDLPISLGLSATSLRFQPEKLKSYAIVGELALDGSTRSAKGTLAMALAAAKNKNLRGIIVPLANGAEASVADDIEIIPVGTLSQAAGFLAGRLELDALPNRADELFANLCTYDVDFSDVRGQETAKRALTVAAAGGHNILMIGPPGTGKSMLAKRFPTILPPLTLAESLETTQIYSAVGQTGKDVPLIVTRPFREPHHTISEAGLVGGGSPPAPGEISLAHNGVLFLDELPEFNRRTLEVLRQPLEDGKVTISRALVSSTFPANFILIGALNPCPCGYRNDPRRTCRCSPPQIEKYMSRMSGPLLDRIDIHIEVPPVDYNELASRQPGTSSADMLKQVILARHIQLERFGRSKARYNSDMSHRQVQNWCQINAEGNRILEFAMTEYGLSARAHDKILRVARTIADLNQSAEIQPEHLHEAISYRTLDRKLWV